MQRRKNEKPLLKKKEPAIANAGVSKGELINALQVHQVELEMQNEQLKASAQEMEKTIARLEMLYNLAPVAYITINNLGIINESNNAASKLLNTESKDLWGTKLQIYIARVSLKVFEEFLRNLNFSGAKHKSEFFLKQRAGRTLYCSFSGSSIFNSRLNLLETHISIVDHTEKYRTRLELRESKERLELALNASGTGTWHINLSDGSFFWDAYKHLLYGLNPGEFDGKYETFLNLIHPDDRKAVDSSVRSAINNERDLHIQYRVVWPNSEVKYLSAKGKITYDQYKTANKLTGVATDITEQKRIELAWLHHKLEHQNHLMRAILKAQEEERTRIGEALHNQIAQTLYAAKLKVNSMISFGENIPVQNSISKFLETAISETRNISFQLFPVILKDFGLVEALKESFNRIRTDDFEITLTASGLDQRLKEEIEIGLFRIVQELINNIIKHSEATQVSVIIEKVDYKIYVQVIDNGKGFDYDKVITSKKGTGLISIKNRLALIKGTFHVTSERKKGTAFDIIIELL